MKCFKTLKKLVGGLSVFALLGVSSFSIALGVGNGGISSTLQTSALNTKGTNVAYGGCMARLTVNSYFPSAGYATLPCAGTNDTYVSFDCEGVLGSKSAGLANFSAAQLAFVTGNAIYVNITANKIDGFCVVDRIDVNNYPTPP